MKKILFHFIVFLIFPLTIWANDIRGKIVVNNEDALIRVGEVNEGIISLWPIPLGLNIASKDFSELKFDQIRITRIISKKISKNNSEVLEIRANIVFVKPIDTTKPLIVENPYMESFIVFDLSGLSIDPNYSEPQQFNVFLQKVQPLEGGFNWWLVLIGILTLSSVWVIFLFFKNKSKNKKRMMKKEWLVKNLKNINSRDELDSFLKLKDPSIQSVIKDLKQGLGEMIYQPDWTVQNQESLKKVCHQVLLQVESSQWNS